MAKAKDDPTPTAEAPSQPVSTGPALKKFSVSLPGMPVGFESVMVEAADPANAWEAFKAKTGVRKTEHEPKIAECSADL